VLDVDEIEPGISSQFACLDISKSKVVQLVVGHDRRVDDRNPRVKGRNTLCDAWNRFAVRSRPAPTVGQLHPHDEVGSFETVGAFGGRSQPKGRNALDSLWVDDELVRVGPAVLDNGRGFSPHQTGP
jgi:hypothetical protein